MKYDTLSAQTYFPLNCPGRETWANSLKKGEVARLGQNGEVAVLQTKEVLGIAKRLQISKAKASNSLQPQQCQSCPRSDTTKKEVGTLVLVAVKKLSL